MRIEFISDIHLQVVGYITSRLASRLSTNSGSRRHYYKQRHLTGPLTTEPLIYYQTMVEYSSAFCFFGRRHRERVAPSVAPGMISTYFLKKKNLNPNV